MDYDVICGMYKMDPENLSASVVAYHVTLRSNAEAIQRGGLKANACVATNNGVERIPAVYLFAARADAYDAGLRKYLFGAQTDLVVVKVTIPRKHFGKMREDGLFNASACCADGGYPFGVQYTDDIPASWIEVI